MSRYLLLVVFSIFSFGALASDRPAPASWQTDGVVPASQLPAERLPAIDPAALRERDAALAKMGEALQFAEPFESHASTSTDGLWEILDDGSQIWRLRFDIPGATDINFGFQAFHLPEGATLHIYDAKQTFFQGPWDADQNRAHGEFWSPVVPGDSAVIELHVPAQRQSEVQLRLVQVAGGYRDLFGHTGGPHLRNHGSCNIDVVCPEGDDWRDQIRSAATYSRGGSRICSGQMINDVPNSLTPFFLTAAHCGTTSGNASSTVVYWNYQAPVCGQQDGGSLADNQSGATLRASRSDVDMALLELDDQPNQDWEIYYSGWDRSDTQPGGAVAIHHPRTHVKSISFAESNLGTTASCIGGGTPNTHWHVPFWDEGTTEPGSSGSGIWNPQNGRLIGFLSGGLASCSVIDYDCYGKFSVAWEGASAASRMRDWLDPDGINPDGIDGTDQDSFNIVPEATSISQCGFNDLDVGIDITQSGTFDDPVTLSTNGLPAGVMDQFSVNPVTPPGSTILTLSELDEAGIGTFAFTVEGAGGGLDRSVNLGVTLNDAAPDEVAITSPGDGDLGVSATPTIEWTAADQGFVYELEIALDAGFSSVVYSATTSATSHEVQSALDTNTSYFVRVRASNDCGIADWSETIGFTTEALPGDCPVGTVADNLMMEDFDGGTLPGGWTTAGSSGAVTWVASTAQTHSGSHSMFAQNIASVSDQRLATSAVSLPNDAVSLFLNFQNWQHIESRTGGCWDGGILEISTNGGGSWDQVSDTHIVVRNYDGPIGTGWSNPLQGQPAWCGDPRDFWERYTVDLSNWAGQDVNFRFRFGTDSSVSRVGWHVDSVNVRACQPAGTHTVGGEVSGLEGSGLVLQNNGVDDLAISGNGPFEFETPLTSGESYLVTVAVQPTAPAQTCDVINGSGTVSDSDITDVEVVCQTDAFTIGGTVSGLEGSGLVLHNNGGDDLAVSADGSFEFSTPVIDGGNYSVSVAVQPENPLQTCTVSNGAGQVDGADVTDIEVNCETETFSIGGTVSGLQGSGLVLASHGESLPIADNGSFVFVTELAQGESYAVTIESQPDDPLEFCVIENGAGTIGTENIDDVIVDCELRSIEVFHDRFESLD